MQEDFLELSRLVTGVENLDPSLGSRYLDRLTSTPYDVGVRQAIHTFRSLKGESDVGAAIKEKILSDPVMALAITQIALIWFTSAIEDNVDTQISSANNQQMSTSPPAILRFGTQDEYFSSLGWRVIGGHVPGLSGGYFGHWRYAPDTGDTP